MRIIPEVSAVDPVPVNLGNGTLSDAIDIQHVETTVSAGDGETVVLAGVLSNNITKAETKIPWLGDLPGVASALFRYRTMNKIKKELIIVSDAARGSLQGRCRPHPRRGVAQSRLCRQGRLRHAGQPSSRRAAHGPYPRTDCVESRYASQDDRHRRLEEVPAPTRGLPNIPQECAARTDLPERGAKPQLPVVRSQPSNVTIPRLAAPCSRPGSIPALPLRDREHPGQGGQYAAPAAIPQGGVQQLGVQHSRLVQQRPISP